MQLKFGKTEGNALDRAFFVCYDTDTDPKELMK